MKTFIAHSSQDHTFVEKLAIRLRGDNVDVWIDDWEIKIGDSIIEKIGKGLENSSFLIAVISPYSIKSDWMKRELNSALIRQLTKKNVVVLPVWLDIDQEQVPILLQDIRAARFYGSNINDGEYSELIASIMEKQERSEREKFQDSFFQNIETMGQILTRKQPTKHQANLIMELIHEPHYANYFFRNTNDLLWFNLLKNSGYFSPDKAPGPRQDEEKRYYAIPLWNVLNYLENVSKQVSTPSNEGYINDLLEIIENVTAYHLKNEKKLDNYHTWFYFIKILCNLPNEKVPETILNLLPVWLDSRFDNLLASSEIAERLLSKFLTHNPADINKAELILLSIMQVKVIPLPNGEKGLFYEKEQLELLIDEHYFQTTFLPAASQIGEKCSKDFILKLASRLKVSLLNKADETWESFYEQTPLIYDAKESISLFLRKSLLAKAKSDPEITREIMQELLKEDYYYFLKLTLYIIAENVPSFKDLFWEMLKTDKGQEIMKETYLWGDELKHLLINIKYLTEDQKGFLKNLVESSVPEYQEEKEKDIMKASHKQGIYGALAHDPYFSILYDDLKKITGRDVGLGPVFSIGKAEYLPEELSQEEKQKTINMTNAEMASYMQMIKLDSTQKSEETRKIIAGIFQLAGKEPVRFINDMDPFMDTSFEFVYHLLDATEKSVKTGETAEWGKLFIFIKKYIERDSFWRDDYKLNTVYWSADHKAIVGRIADLIRHRTQEDSLAFPEEFNDLAKEILLLMLYKLEGPEEIEREDYVSYMLNSATGKELMALIQLSLRIARLGDKKDANVEQKWLKDLKQGFEEAMKRDTINAYTCLGMYLANIYYLDRNWTEHKIVDMIPHKSANNQWQAFMEGYLCSSTTNLYKVIYSLMKPHYELAMTVDFKENIAKEHYYCHIGYGYLAGWDNLDESNCLMKKLLELWDSGKIVGVIHYLRHQREYLRYQSDETNKIRDKILSLWALVFEKLKERKEELDENDKKIASSTALLVDFLSEINEKNAKWLGLAARYVNIGFNSPNFIEALNRLKDQGDPFKVADCLAELLDSMLQIKGFTPDYNPEHIKEIVKFLFKNGQEDKAKDICNEYGKREYMFLQDVWKEFN
jgi:hypothetical protein